jgi:hypothetical protein
MRGGAKVDLILVMPVALLNQKHKDSPKLHLVPVFVIDPLHPSPPHVKHYYTLNTY